MLTWRLVRQTPKNISFADVRQVTSYVSFLGGRGYGKVLLHVSYGLRFRLITSENIKKHYEVHGSAAPAGHEVDVLYSAQLRAVRRRETGII